MSRAQAPARVRPLWLLAALDFPLLACRGCGRPLRGDAVCSTCEHGDVIPPAMLERAADIRMMVRHLTGIERLRAIAHMDSYVLEHLAHAARTRGSVSCRAELDLTDTAKLEVVR